LVKKLADNLKIPVFCKIRILPEKERTMALVKGIEDNGCSLLTVHGRTKEQNKHLVGKCDWDIIKEIKETLKIPVYANGGIHKFQDVIKCLDYTGVDGVMSAESLLENPALFSGEVHDLDDLALEYYDMWKKYEEENPRYLKPHLFKIMHKGLSENVDLRDKLGNCHKPEECHEIILELKKRRKDTPRHDKFGWYERYQSYAPQTSQEPKKKRSKQPDGEIEKDDENGGVKTEESLKKIKTE
jgi:tRNA-dihydrouridine synthase